MQKFIYILVITFITLSANAQLNNSKWKTTLQLDQPVEVVFNFTADTLNVLSTGDNSSLETMKYKINDTVLTIQKLYGQSECDSSIGTYSYKITGTDMWLKLMSDACSDRSGIIGNLKLTRTQ